MLTLCSLVHLPSLATLSTLAKTTLETNGAQGMRKTITVHSGDLTRSGVPRATHTKLSSHDGEQRTLRSTLVGIPYIVGGHRY